jgi:hypothetical protein
MTISALGNRPRYRSVENALPFTVEAALTRLSVALGTLRPRVDHRAAGLPCPNIRSFPKLSLMNEPTPNPRRQLRLKELSNELRATLWFVIHENFDQHAYRLPVADQKQQRMGSMI